MMHAIPLFHEEVFMLAEKIINRRSDLACRPVSCWFEREYLGLFGKKVRRHGERAAASTIDTYSPPNKWKKLVDDRKWKNSLKGFNSYPTIILIDDKIAYYLAHPHGDIHSEQVEIGSIPELAAVIERPVHQDDVNYQILRAKQLEAEGVKARTPVDLQVLELMKEYSRWENQQEKEHYDRQRQKDNIIRGVDFGAAGYR